jgi:hypothetical protein
MVGAMSSDPVDQRSIEMKKSFRPPEELTVAEYDARFQQIKSARTVTRCPRGWVPGAPPVEALAPGPYESNKGWIRVVDPEAYDLQMRKLLGIL